MTKNMFMRYILKSILIITFLLFPIKVYILSDTIYFKNGSVFDDAEVEYDDGKNVWINVLGAKMQFNKNEILKIEKKEVSRKVETDEQKVTDKKPELTEDSVKIEEQRRKEQGQQLEQLNKEEARKMEEEVKKTEEAEEKQQKMLEEQEQHLEQIREEEARKKEEEEKKLAQIKEVAEKKKLEKEQQRLEQDKKAVLEEIKSINEIDKKIKKEPVFNRLKEMIKRFKGTKFYKYIIDNWIIILIVLLSIFLLMILRFIHFGVRLKKLTAMFITKTIETFVSFRMGVRNLLCKSKGKMCLLAKTTKKILEKGGEIARKYISICAQEIYQVVQNVIVLFRKFMSLFLSGVITKIWTYTREEKTKIITEKKKEGIMNKQSFLDKYMAAIFKIGKVLSAIFVGICLAFFTVSLLGTIFIRGNGFKYPKFEKYALYEDRENVDDKKYTDASDYDEGYFAREERRKIEDTYSEKMEKMIKYYKLNSSAYDSIAGSIIECSPNRRSEYMKGLNSFLRDAQKYIDDKKDKTKINISDAFDHYNQMFDRSVKDEIASKNVAKGKKLLLVAIMGGSLFVLMGFLALPILLKIEQNTRQIVVNSTNPIPSEKQVPTKEEKTNDT